MRNILGLIVVLAIGYYIRGVVWNRVTSSITANNSDCLAVLGSTTTEVDGGNYIVGNVQNNCDRSFSNVTVTFKLDRTQGPSSMHRATTPARPHRTDCYAS